VTGGNAARLLLQVATASSLLVMGSGFHLDATLGPASVTTDGVSFTYNPTAVGNWSFAGARRWSTHRRPGLRRLDDVAVAGLGSLHVDTFDVKRS